MSFDPEAVRERAHGGTFLIVPYCHPDYAWTHHREWHEERYAVSICDALDLMREHPEFRFCVEPWIDQIAPFLERCPDRVGELAERLSSGQMGVLAATLTSPRPATCPDETFIRNTVLGRRQYRRLAPDADLSVMSCPDVGIGHSQMPQVVTLAGFGLYRGWRSDAAFSRLGVPREFRWRGLDGTELLTSRGIYGGLWTESQLPPDFRERWAEVTGALLSTELGRATELSQSTVWWVAQGMDDARPLRAAGADALLPVLDFSREWCEREDSAMIFATPNEYRRMLAEQSLPVWDGVIDQVDVAYNSGWHGARGLWRTRRELDQALLVCERACALARLASARAPAPEELERLWTEAVRVNSHAEQWVFTRDWEWLSAGARATLREIGEVADRAVASLSGLGRTSDEDGRPLVLFNPLPYPRDELVEVPWVHPRLDVCTGRVVDSAGRTVDAQFGEQPGATWDRPVETPLIFRASLPPLGCAVYRVCEGPAPEPGVAPEGGALSNGRFALSVSERGLRTVFDPASGIAWNAPRGGAIGDCRLFEMGPGVLHVGPVVGEVGAPTGTGRWVLTGPYRWVYRWEGAFHGHKVSQDIIVDDGAPHIDLVTRVFCGGACGFFGLAFDLPVRGELSADIPFGVEKRNLSAEPYGPDMPLSEHNIERWREDQLWARSWVSASDGTRGVTVISVDGDSYWTYHAETGRLTHILFTALREDHPARWEDWEKSITLDRLALGWHTFRHRLVIHEGDWRAAGICVEADRLRFPPVPAKPRCPAPEAPGNVIGGLSVAPASVRLSAFYEDAGGYVLRLYESSGTATTAEVVLPCPLASATRTDFNLEPIDAEVGIQAQRLSVPLRPWEIATVVLL